MFESDSTTMIYQGFPVIGKTSYDMSRKISVGRATDNEILKADTVRDALEFMRGEKSRRRVEAARTRQEQIAERVEAILLNARETGQMYVPNDDPLWAPSGWSRMTSIAHKDLISTVTGVYQQFQLDKQESWNDEINIISMRDKILALGWRMAKALLLWGWMFAGTFSQRTVGSLLTSSGLMALDFDHVADVGALVAKLRADDLVFAAVKSPSSTGVKAIIRVPDEAAKDPKSLFEKSF